MFVYRRTSRLAAILVASLLCLAPLAALAYDWPQFNGNPQHSGNNSQEILLTVKNAPHLQFLFHATLPSIADGAPAYLSGVTTNSGTRDLVFVTTKAGHIIALDAHSGAQIWSHQYAAGSCRINNDPNRICYTTSSPAIDPNKAYVYSYGLDGKVHKYQVGDGAEIMTGGWPEVTSLKPEQEKGSSALSIATARSGTSYLYMTNGGYPGDAGDYQGHVTAINLATGAQKVFNTMCSNQAVHFTENGSPDCAGVQTAIWARPGVIYDSNTDKLFMATGNGTFDPSSHYWGDTVFALSPDGTGFNGDPLDTYTPVNFQQLQDTDADIGSTAPAILPAPANSNVQHLAVQGGKDAKLRLLNLDLLSGQSGVGHTGGEVGGLSNVINVPQGGEVLTQPAVWVNPNDLKTWVYVVNDNGISALRLTVDGSGNPSLTLAWQNGHGGASPTVANGVVYYAGNGTIWGLNAITGATLFSDSANIGGTHWESPMVANGILYITDESSQLTAYYLPAPSGPKDTIGIYRNATFYLRNSNTTGVADIVVPFGSVGNIPVTGDWNGDGVDTIGVYDTGTGLFSLRDSNTPGAATYLFTFGNPGDKPLSGRWDATMSHDGVGVYRPSNGLLYLRHTLTTGVADYTIVLGNPGDVGIAGDWNGDTFDSPGVFRPSKATFYINNKVISGIIRADSSALFGTSTSKPVIGDWTGAGRSGIGAYDDGNVTMRNTATAGSPDIVFFYGKAGDVPVAGHWVAGTGPQPNHLAPIETAPTSAPTPASPTPQQTAPGDDIRFD